MNDKKREEQALDGLFAASMRSADEERVPTKLPELTAEEEAALDFGVGFVERLVAGEVVRSSDATQYDDAPNWEDEGHFALASDGVEFALNRAEEVDEEELERREQEIIDRVRKRREQDG